MKRERKADRSHFRGGLGTCIKATAAGAHLGAASWGRHHTKTSGFSLGLQPGEVPGGCGWLLGQLLRCRAPPAKLTAGTATSWKHPRRAASLRSKVQNAPHGHEPQEGSGARGGVLCLPPCWGCCGPPLSHGASLRAPTREGGLGGRLRGSPPSLNPTLKAVLRAGQPARRPHGEAVPAAPG